MATINFVVLMTVKGQWHEDRDVCVFIHKIVKRESVGMNFD